MSIVYSHNKYGLIATNNFDEGVADISEVLPFTVIFHEEEWAQLGVYRTKEEAEEAIVEYRERYKCKTKATVENTLKVLNGELDAEYDDSDSASEATI